MARKCLFLVQWEASRFVDVIEAVVLYIEGTQSWVVMMGDDSQGLADAAGSGSTLRGTTLRGGGMFVDSNGPVTPAGSKTLSVHGGATDRWSVVIASFKP